MSVPVRVVVGALAVALIVIVGRTTALAEPEAVAPPAPEAIDSLPEPQFPNSYSPLDAGEEARKMAEKQRRAAIDRQLGLEAELRHYATLPRPIGTVPYVRPYASGFGAVYAYPEHRSARRAWKYERRYHHLYGYFPHPGYVYRGYGYPNVYAPLPYLFGYPYVGHVDQPVGHKRIWTSPNGYIYRSVHPSDVKPPEPEKSAPAASQPPPEPPAEPIPAPPAEVAPR